ncbi:MAG: APC family permease [Candidatus Aminicenantia bacterium]
MEKLELERRLGFLSATNIVIANMIGAGIFTTSGLLIEKIPNVMLILFLWIFGGFTAFCGALSYCLLGIKFPMAGGEYIYLSKLFHPLLGFLSGWISFFVGFSAPISASAIGFIEYLSRAFPAVVNFGLIQSEFKLSLIKKLYSAIIILIFTAIHIRGLSPGSRVQNFLTFLKIVLIIAFIMAGILSEKGEVSHFSYGEKFLLNFGNIKLLSLSLMWIMFAYSGWNASSYIGSEIKNPSRNIPLSLLLGTLTVSLLYFLLNVIYIYAINPEEMKGVISVGGLAMKNLFGEKIERLSSILISFALFSSLSAFIILGPRVYYAMSKDGYFFKFASDIHPIFRVPSKSILLQCVISIIILITGTFEEILTYMSFSLLIFPMIAIFGIFRIHDKTHFKIPYFPLPPIFYISISSLIIIFGFLEKPVPSIIAIATIIAGIPFYYILKRRGVR